jgi:outer membrane lipoprotein
MRFHFNRLLPLLAPAALLTLVACAPAPIYQPAPGTLAVPPQQVALTPERYGNAGVIWGGRIVGVQNFADHSEIELLAYPLDGSQRPRINDTGNGRFIALMPGYVEPLDYPAGSLMTLTGHLSGTRAGKVGQADYMFPLVRVDASHVWTAEELRSSRSNVHFGLGLGVGIH